MTTLCNLGPSSVIISFSISSKSRSIALSFRTTITSSDDRRCGRLGEKSSTPNCPMLGKVMLSNIEKTLRLARWVRLNNYGGLLSIKSLYPSDLADSEQLLYKLKH
ncbi:hypothetical protein FRC19_009367 [Serendipita sp. 401]|nr:hypothetical protein FRC19_009367 [Serendipita sp. 401]